MWICLHLSAVIFCVLPESSREEKKRKTKRRRRKNKCVKIVLCFCVSLRKRRTKKPAAITIIKSVWVCVCMFSRSLPRLSFESFFVWSRRRFSPTKKTKTTTNNSSEGKKYHSCCRCFVCVIIFSQHNSYNSSWGKSRDTERERESASISRMKFSFSLHCFCGFDLNCACQKAGHVL